MGKGKKWLFCIICFTAYNGFFVATAVNFHNYRTNTLTSIYALKIILLVILFATGTKFENFVIRNEKFQSEVIKLLVTVT